MTASRNLEEEKERLDEEFALQAEPIVICAGLGEEGNVMGLMRNRPSPVVSGAAMIRAAQCGHEKVVQVLLKGKADIHSHQAGKALETFVKEIGHLTAVPMFLKFGMNPHNKSAARVLELAADKGQGDGLMVVKALVKHGLDPHSDIAYKGLALASQGGHEAIVKYLVECKSLPNCHEGMEALKTASLMGQFKVVKILLAAKADASSKEGNDALHCSVHIGSDSLVRLLLDSGADPSAGLPAAAFRGSIDFVKLLLEQQADGRSRKKALREAARFGHQAILRQILTEGVDITSSAGDSALRLAVSNNRAPEVKNVLVETLTKAGARRMPEFALPALPGSPLPSKEEKIARTSLTKSFKSFRKIRSLPNLARRTF